MHHDIHGECLFPFLTGSRLIYETDWRAAPPLPDRRGVISGNVFGQRTPGFPLLLLQPGCRCLAVAT